MFNECFNVLRFMFLGFLIKRIERCKNNFEKSSTIKLCEHIPCRYSTSAIKKFDGIENKYDVYRGADCMEIILFCESLREHLMKIINFEKQ